MSRWRRQQRRRARRRAELVRCGSGCGALLLRSELVGCIVCPVRSCPWCAWHRHGVPPHELRRVAAVVADRKALAERAVRYPLKGRRKLYNDDRGGVLEKPGGLKR